MKHELVSHKKLQDTLSHRCFKVKSVISRWWCVVRDKRREAISPSAPLPLCSSALFPRLPHVPESPRFGYTNSWFVTNCSTGMEIGQKVKVYRLRDRVSPPVVKRLGQVGTVKGFKMTDGSGVGVVVQFDDNFSTWFFEDEIKPT